MRFHYIFILYSVSYVTKNTFENLKQILFIMNDGITVLKIFNILPITFCRLINGKKKFYYDCVRPTCHFNQNKYLLKHLFGFPSLNLN